MFNPYFSATTNNKFPYSNSLINSLEEGHMSDNAYILLLETSLFVLHGSDAKI